MSKDKPEILYRELHDFLFNICEQFAHSFKPDNVSLESFLGFTIYALERKFREKYPPPSSKK